MRGRAIDGNWGVGGRKRVRTAVCSDGTDQGLTVLHAVDAWGPTFARACVFERGRGGGWKGSDPRVQRLRRLGRFVGSSVAGLAMGETRQAGVDLAFACPGIILLGACPGIILLGEVPNDLRFTFGFCDSQQPILRFTPIQND